MFASMKSRSFETGSLGLKKLGHQAKSKEKLVGLNNSLLNIMSTTQTYKNDIEDQITS